MTSIAQISENEQQREIKGTLKGTEGIFHRIPSVRTAENVSC